MGRKKIIALEDVLDAAERIISDQGAAALTIDAIAKSLGITKGGVQYTVGTKDELIAAMFDRLDQMYMENFNLTAGDNPSPLGVARAHVHAMGRNDDIASMKSASLMAALLQTPEDLNAIQNWMRARIEGLDMKTEEGRNARVAFLAAEGAFLIRYFGFMKIDDQEWNDIFSDLDRLVPR